MAIVKNVEKRIFDIVAFEVRSKNVNGRALNSNSNLALYTCYERMASNKWTVQDWKDNRFKRDYPGYLVDVLDGNGRVARGSMVLGRIRDTYLVE